MIGITEILMILGGVLLVALFGGKVFVKAWKNFLNTGKEIRQTTKDFKESVDVANETINEVIKTAIENVSVQENE